MSTTARCGSGHAAADVGQRAQLERRYAEIGARCAACSSAYAAWPCRRGCDACCRALARAPQVSAVEWLVMLEGMSLLAEETQREVMRRIAALPDGETPGGPVVCPLLDAQAGSCRIYAHRPAACRMHGFYVHRGEGLWCQQIETLSASGALDGVVLGNHTVVLQRIEDELGEARSLREWWGAAAPTAGRA